MWPANSTRGAAASRDANELPRTSAQTRSAKPAAYSRHSRAAAASSPDGPGVAVRRFRKSSELVFIRLFQLHGGGLGRLALKVKLGLTQLAHCAFGRAML